MQAFKLTVVVHVLPSLDSIELVSAVGDFDNYVPIVSPSEASNRSVGDFDNSVPVNSPSDASNRSTWTDEQKANKIIAMSQRLDFDVRVSEEAHDSAEGWRPSRALGGSDVEIIDRKTPTQVMRLIMVNLAQECGYNASSKEKRNAIAESACRIVSYDHGFKKSPIASVVHEWISCVDKAMRTDTNNVLADR